MFGSRTAFYLIPLFAFAAVAASSTSDVALAQCDVKRKPLDDTTAGSQGPTDGQSLGNDSGLQSRIELFKGGEVVVLTFDCSEASLPIAARVDSVKKARGGPTNLLLFRARAGGKALGDGPTNLLRVHPPASEVPEQRAGNLLPSQPRLNDVSLKDESAVPHSASSPVAGAALRERPAADGVMVESVEPGSPAWRDGLRRADMIASANRIRVRDMAGLEAALASAGPTVVLEVRRGSGERIIVLHR